jgi:hypothetical protein
MHLKMDLKMDLKIDLEIELKIGPTIDPKIGPTRRGSSGASRSPAGPVAVRGAGRVRDHRGAAMTTPPVDRPQILHRLVTCRT